MTLPESVRDAAGPVPLGEDLALDLFRRLLPDLQWVSLLTPAYSPPFALVREVTFYGAWTPDRRFIREYFITIETFTEGLESDVEGPLIHRAAENVLLRASLAHEPVLDGAGWLEAAELVEPARRVSDWASANGPVQFADLPQGWTRHISTHRLTVKRSDVGPHIYDY